MFSRAPHVLSVLNNKSLAGLSPTIKLKRKVPRKILKHDLQANHLRKLFLVVSVQHGISCGSVITEYSSVVGSFDSFVNIYANNQLNSWLDFTRGYFLFPKILSVPLLIFEPLKKSGNVKVIANF